MQMSHVRLLAPNVRECFLFYRDVIGLEVLYGNEDTPFAEFKTGDVHLALEPPMVDQAGRAVPDQLEFSAGDRVALIFRDDEIDATYERLKGKGVAFVKAPRDVPDWNMRVAYFRDPAGNLIELNKGI